MLLNTAWLLNMGFLWLPHMLNRERDMARASLSLEHVISTNKPNFRLRPADDSWETISPLFSYHIPYKSSRSRVKTVSPDCLSINPQRQPFLCTNHLYPSSNLFFPTMAQYFSTSWMAGSRSAAYYAALSLVAIQVGIGIIMKSSQTGGQYSFSASASVTISEFLKLLLSGLFFWRECRKRQTSFHSAPTDIESPSSSRSSSSSSEPINQDEQDNEKTIIYTRLTLRAYLEFCKNELSTSTRYGFAQLALLYALINNSVRWDVLCEIRDSIWCDYRSLLPINSLIPEPFLSQDLA